MKVGDIVEVAYSKPRRGMIVDRQGRSFGIRYFNSYTVRGVASDFIWWIDSFHIRIISEA